MATLLSWHQCHAGLIQAIKTTTEIVGVMRAQPEMGLENIAAYHRAPLGLLPKLPVSDRSLHSHGSVKVNTSRCGEPVLESRLFVVHGPETLSVIS